MTRRTIGRCGPLSVDLVGLYGPISMLGYTTPCDDGPMSDEPLDYHEEHAGPVIPDPWDDDNQPDWPNKTIEEVMTSGDNVGSDEGSRQLP